MAGQGILPDDKWRSRHVKNRLYFVILLFFLLLNCKYSGKNLKCSNKGTKTQAFHTLIGAVKVLKLIQDSINNCLKEDHRSYIRNLSSCEKKALKKNQACTGFEPLTSAIPVKRSTN